MEIDRLAPTHRPDLPLAGYQRWRSLLFLHWSIRAADLRPLVPAQLKLDLFDNTAFIGVVPFMMQDVRPRWWPERFALNFLETNVRTYVLHNGRPGVYFFSLDANSRLAVHGARLRWGLPYFHATMSVEHDGESIHYQSRRSRRGPSHDVRFQVGEHLGPSLPDTLEHFLLERYLLFVERHDRIYTGQVHHPPYPAQLARVESISDELISAAGLPSPSRPPEFAHYASGVDVEVFPLRKTANSYPNCLPNN